MRDVVSCLPASHNVQLVRDAVSCLPASHNVQLVRDVVSSLPASHKMQLAVVWLDSDWYRPASQSRQDVPDRY